MYRLSVANTIAATLACVLSACQPLVPRPNSVGSGGSTLLPFDGARDLAGPTSTYSIVGHDPKTGDLGVAVQSRFFGVAAVVPWVRGGVGAIATQSYANTSFGPRGLEFLRRGRDAQEVLDALVESDDRRERRQVGIVDAKGRAATYTGKGCFPWAGGRTGEGYAAQGNILVGQETVDAMAKAFVDAAGEELAERLMRALEAGQRAGGDIRGRQSAAIQVVRKDSGYGGNDRYVWLSVDDHPRPVAELRRLLNLSLRRDPASRARRTLRTGRTDEARRLLDRAEAENPRDPHVPMQRAALELAAGKVDAMRQAIERALAIQPDYDNLYYRAAELYLRAEKPGPAVELLKRLVQLNPAYRARITFEADRPGPFQQFREALESSSLLHEKSDG